MRLVLLHPVRERLAARAADRLSSAFHGPSRYRHRPAFSRAAALVALLAALSSCRRPDPAAAAVTGIANAAEKGDADRAASYVSAAYRDPDGRTRADVALLIRQLLAGYESLDIGISRLEISPGVRFARARFRASLSGTPRAAGGLEGFLPRSAAYDFEVELTEETPGTYRVTSATWTRAGG